MKDIMNNLVIETKKYNTGFLLSKNSLPSKSSLLSLLAYPNQVTPLVSQSTERFSLGRQKLKNSIFLYIFNTISTDFKRLKKHLSGSFYVI